MQIRPGYAAACALVPLPGSRKRSPYPHAASTGAVALASHCFTSRDSNLHLIMLHFVAAISPHPLQSVANFITSSIPEAQPFPDILFRNHLVFTQFFHNWRFFLFAKHLSPFSRPVFCKSSLTHPCFDKSFILKFISVTRPCVCGLLCLSQPFSCTDSCL